MLDELTRSDGLEGNLGYKLENIATKDEDS